MTTDVRRSAASLAAFSFSIAGLATLIVWAQVGQAGLSPAARMAATLLGAAGAVSSVAVFESRRLAVYRSAQVWRIALYILSLFFSRKSPAIEHLLLAGVLTEVCICEPYPPNVVICLGILAVALAARAIASVGLGLSAGDWVESQVPFAVLGTSLSILGCRMIAHRETNIDLRLENRHLADSVVQLTRANAEYLDYAALAEEAGIDGERRRITRDVHDVVGYTLTNNIMLMESAIDMMNENPLGIPALIEAARSNAEEGLTQIRKSLYDLRRQDTRFPVGLRAIQRLAAIFEKATGIAVRCEYGNLPWTLTEDVDSALYHLVQESLVNSFRHGRAHKVGVHLWMANDRVYLQVTDDGIGAAVIKEGIGLQGMRERVAKLGGSVSVSGAAGRFTVRAEVPTAAATRGEPST